MGERSPALEAVFRPLERPTTLDEIVKRLGTAIRLGVLAPGSQLVRFHIALAETARSPRLVLAMTEVHGDLSDVLDGQAHAMERLTHSNEQHRALLTLVRQGDVANASQLIREHIGDTDRILAARKLAALRRGQPKPQQPGPTQPAVWATDRYWRFAY